MQYKADHPEMDEDSDVKVSSITEEYSASYDPDEESELVEVIAESVDEAETGFEEEEELFKESLKKRLMSLFHKKFLIWLMTS